MSTSLVVHIMTAALSPGDAIGNYVMTLRRLLTEFGCRVKLYADHVAPQYRLQAYPSVGYCPTGHDVLWYHYSIYADNLALVESSTDYKVMDFHGVSPPHLFAGYNSRLERLCRLGNDLLPSFRDRFDLCVVHSEYSRRLLQERGFAHIEKLPLIVDTARYDATQDEALSAWLRRLPYLLFVGRIVPQKDVLALLNLFAYLRSRRPEVALLLVGGRDLAPAYQREIDRAVERLGLSQRVLFTGHITDPAMLASLFRHARFTVITSEWESFCVPVVESMFFETPVVIHHVPPLPEVARDAGLVIDKHRPEAAADLIDGTWADGHAYEQLKQACRQRAPHFTTLALRTQLLSMLRRAFV
jgi:glycosyltransferase involved in cell wall biosynthesis